VITSDQGAWVGERIDLQTEDACSGHSGTLSRNFKLCLSFVILLRRSLGLPDC